jgi:hypothetical protein
MAHTVMQTSSSRAAFRFLTVVLLLAGAAACYRSWPKPRRGMDALWCPQDSVRMAYVVNRGPGSARLMVRPWSRGDWTADLAELASGETGEYTVPDSIMVFSYNGELATPVPRAHAQAIPPPASPAPRVEVEYFCR